MNQPTVEEIRVRHAACPIPLDAQADWEGTNHYEITDPSPEVSGSEYWWLDGLDVYELNIDSSTETGKRLGAVLDYACAYRRDVGALIQERDSGAAIPRDLAEALKEWRKRTFAPTFCHRVLVDVVDKYLETL